MSQKFLKILISRGNENINQHTTDKYYEVIIINQKILFEVFKPVVMIPFHRPISFKKFQL
jgi:hypothetical protein